MKYIITLIFVLQPLYLHAATTHGDFGPFMRSLNNKEYGYQVIKDVTGTAPLAEIEKFEIRSGDCAENKGWNDCKKDRERSELSERKKTTSVNSEYWYGWSIYFPKNYPNIYPTKTALGQFHQKGSHPIWMFQNSSGGYHLDDQVFGKTRRYYPLIDEKELRGQWHKIEVHVRWAKDNSGFFQVWVNGEQKVDYQGQTMDADKVYFKYGVYRSFLSRYKKANHRDEIPTQIVYFANVKRGATRKSLQP